MLILRVDADAVLAELPGHATDPHRAVLHETGFNRRADPIPSRRVSRVGVRKNAVHRHRGAQVTVAAVEPEAIALDRTAVRGAPVVRGDDAGIRSKVRV